MVEPSLGSGYPEYWEADVVLRDGATAHLRPIAPSDADAVQAFHAQQSQASIYLRFFSFKAKLSAKEIKRFTEVDHKDRVALVMTFAGEIIGISRYDRLENPDEAEVAFNISDRHQGRGIGSILLEHLAAAARENGIKRFTAEVLPENRKMLMVFADAGYEVQRHFDDGVVSVGFNISLTQKSRAVMESREHRAEAKSVQGLLAPQSIAVIGASRTWGKLGYQLLQNIVEGGYTGSVFAVNPEAIELAGMLSYGKVSEIPTAIDLAVIAVPYSEVPAVVQECAEAGVKGVLIATAGFADDGDVGLARQRAIVRHARANGMRVIGPASVGLINTDPAISLNASAAPALPVAGGLGLFSQSAAIGVALFAAASRRSLGISSFLSAGNRADVSGNDLMQFWEDDPDTNAVGMYLESIGNPRKFSRIARRISRTKPVIVARSLVTGAELPPGHVVRTTRAPQGAVDAMFRQSGVISVETVEELCDVSQVISTQPLPRGGSIAVISNSLALGKVVGDSARAHGLTVQRTVAELDLDTGMSLALPALRESLSEALEHDGVDAAVVTLLPSRGLTVEHIAEVLQECGAQAGKPVVAAFTGILDVSIHVEGLLRISKDFPALPCYSNPGAAVAALAAVVGYARWREQELSQEAVLATVPEGLQPAKAESLLERLLRGQNDATLMSLEGTAAQEFLDCYGIKVLESRTFETPLEAVAAADELGWPVVLKTTNPALKHRIDLGGVRLDIRDGASLRRNIVAMERALAAYGKSGMEVQSMAGLGQACVVRAIEDPLLGPVISFGMSGDAVKLLDDWAHRIPPLSDQDINELVRAPRASVKLFGYEGLPAVNVQALEDLVARVAVLKDNHPEVALLDFAAVLVSQNGVSVLSVDLKIANPEQRTDSARRAMRA
ncbi:GNAT family N-acetyltransferase [Pseudarthrobacter sp. J1763]|uniref:bifunctional acetate--CoA ligase family protein/GNAT family N-acetyltransferase n=1 Tax=Pseudarthrobacter sp. J1763 TaxID=3420445 RepID=UPI003D27B421